MDYGIKFAIEEKNALTSINPRDFLIWSKYKDFKILKKANSSLLISTGNLVATQQIAHGMGYPPAYYAWVDLQNNGKFYMLETNSGVQVGSVNAHSTDTSAADNTNISFRGVRDASVSDEYMPFAYVIFDQRGIGTFGGNDRPIGYVKQDYGIKFTQGKNVFDSKIYEQVINSNCELLNYHATRTIGLSWDNSSNGTNSATIIHGLGYVPMFLVWGNFGSSAPSGFNKDRLLPIGQIAQPFTSSAWADTNEIQIEIGWAGGGSSSGIFNARVVVFTNAMLI